MSRGRAALAALSFSSTLILSAATRIEDPKIFVSEVYRRFVTTQSVHSSYKPPEGIYTTRLAKLLREDRRKAKGEVGCVDFVFWLNAQDWEITQLAVSSENMGTDQRIVIARFRNIGEPQEIRFDFRREAGRWLLDDVQSMASPPWTLSELLKCAR